MKVTKIEIGHGYRDTRVLDESGTVFPEVAAVRIIRGVKRDEVYVVLRARDVEIDYGPAIKDPMQLDQLDLSMRAIPAFRVGGEAKRREHVDWGNGTHGIPPIEEQVVEAAFARRDADLRP